MDPSILVAADIARQRFAYLYGYDIPATEFRPSRSRARWPKLRSFGWQGQAARAAAATC